MNIIIYVVVFCLFAVIVSDAGLKPTLFKYVSLFFSSLFSIVLAFNYFELAGGILISKGIIPQWAQFASFTLIFLVSLIVLWFVADKLTKEEIKLPMAILRSISILFSVIFTVLLIGTIYAALCLAPMGKTFPYAHFTKETPLTPNNIEENSNASVLSLDKIVTDIFCGFSKGSLSSGNSFGNAHPDFQDTCFIDRACIEDRALTLAGEKSIVLSNNLDEIIKKARKNLKDKENKSVKPNANNKFVTLSLQFTKIKFTKGGAVNDKDFSLVFNTGQLRMLCKDEKGNTVLVYPHGYINSDKKLVHRNLNEPISYGSKDFSPKERTIGMTLLFEIPEDSIPSALTFRQNFITEFPKPAKKKSDITETSENL